MELNIIHKIKSKAVTIHEKRIKQIYLYALEKTEEKGAKQ
jgi:hypothetical protein